MRYFYGQCNCDLCGKPVQKNSGGYFCLLCPEDSQRIAEAEIIEKMHQS